MSLGARLAGSPLVCHCCAVAASLATECAESIRLASAGERPGWTKDPAGREWVSEVDLQNEALVADAVAKLFPGHALVGEEGGARPGEPDLPTWLVDPLDGTTNFLAGLPWVGVSISVSWRGQVVAGAVADAYGRRVLLARAGGGAWVAPQGARGSVGGRFTAARVRACPQGLSGQVVLTELVGSQAWPGLGELAESLSRQRASLRILGSTSLTLAAVATGRAAAAVLADYHHLDTAASVLGASEAGAEVLANPDENLLPSRPVPGLRGLVVASPGVAEEVLELFCAATTRA